MIIPYDVDVPFDRKPIANWIIIGVTCAVSVLAMVDNDLFRKLMFGRIEFETTYVTEGTETFEVQIPSEITYPLSGYFTAVLVHAGILHLVGNMLFLFVFGNAVNAKLGNIAYVAIYLLMAFVSSTAHMVFDPGPAVGASGAIYGVMGVFLVLFPLNNVECWLLVFYRLGDTFSEISVSSIWIIFYWIACDALLMWFDAAGNVGVVAHLGGAIAGITLGMLLVATKVVRPTEWERTLLDVIQRRGGAS